MHKAPAIGIDLGATYSCVGVFQHGKVEIIANDQGNRTTLSYDAFPDSERLIGDATKNQVAMNPSNKVFDTTGSDNIVSLELTEGIRSMFHGVEKAETAAVKPPVVDKKVSTDAVLQSDGNDLTCTSQDSSVSRRRQCPALDFEQLKMKLGQLTASKKVKPDLRVEVPDGKEPVQATADASSCVTAPPVIPPVRPSFPQPSSMVPEVAASGIVLSSAVLQMAESMPAIGSGFSPATPNIPALHSMGQLPPVLDSRQMYMYPSALQSQTLASLNQVDRFLLSAIQGQQAYHDMYLQPLQQIYSGSPGMNASYAMSQPQFLAQQQNILYGAPQLADWHRASMMYGLQALSVQDMSHQAAAII